jgi:NADPH2:quinone reductase
VITSASKDEGIRILKEEYKIKDVINHAKENVVDRVYELTQGQGVDIAYDSTYNESSIEKSIQTVKEGGSCIVLGSSMKDNSAIAKNVAEHKAVYVFADLGRYWIGSDQTQLKTFVQSSLKQGAKWIEEGKLKPYINRIIKLEEAQDALEQIKQGKSGFGKVVVKIL